jgi:small subunit ribosomal protein S20
LFSISDLVLRNSGVAGFRRLILPTTKTAEKEMRTAERKKARNKSVRSQTKTHVSKAEGIISSGNLEAAQAEVKSAISALDKEAEQGKAHRNSAARRKSRLMKKLNQAAASAKEAPAKTEK